MKHVTLIQIFVWSLLSLYSTFICANDSPWDYFGYACVGSTSNLAGGRKTGTLFDQGLRATVVYSLDKQYGLQEAKIAAGIIAIGNNHPQSLYVGALQNPNTYNDAPGIRITDLSYQQRLDKYFLFKVGIMDFDDYFNITETAEPLLNSALSNTETLNLSVQLASYPYPGFGAFAKIGSPKVFLLAGIFQGNPQHQKSVFNRGQLVVAEFNNHFNVKHIDYSVKLAIWDYQQPLDSIPLKDGTGVYGIFQASWDFWGRKIGCGLNLGHNSKKEETVYFSYAVSCVTHGLFKQRPLDSFNLATGRVLLEGGMHPETFYEVGYKFHLYKTWSLTPDLQYFTNPGAQYKNSWVATLHLMYRFPKS